VAAYRVVYEYFVMNASGYGVRRTDNCCMYSEELLMTDRGTVRNTWFYSKNKFEKLVHLIGFIIRTVHEVVKPQLPLGTKENHDRLHTK